MSELSIQAQQKIKIRIIKEINNLITSKNNLEQIIDYNAIPDSAILSEEKQNNILSEERQIQMYTKSLQSIISTAKDKNIQFTPEEIETYGYNPYEKAEEVINKTIIKPMEPLFHLNYNYDVTLINLRDIRFSQSSISSPFPKETEDTLESFMKNYPFKFYNYKDNDLILLGMFGENDYTFSDKEKTSHNPTVPSLNVVHFPKTNCYVSIDNRRIELIYRQLCLLLSTEQKSCSIDNMMFKNTNDFLRFELGIPNDAHIYIPCCVKPSDGVPPRLMKTPDGLELEKLNKELGRPIDTIAPTYAGVIWQRVSHPHLDKFRSDILSGIQGFPVNSLNNSNQKLNDNSQIKIYKNNFFCRKTEDVAKGPINITTIVNNLVQQGIIKNPYVNKIPETEYKNLQTLYYHVANIFINYLLNGTTEFTEIISFDTLFGNNEIKFIRDFEQWKINIDKIPLYPEKTGGRSLKHKAVSGETRKRCKYGYRKNKKQKNVRKKNTTKKCAKKKYNKKK
jgi:hypothetical protein